MIEGPGSADLREDDDVDPEVRRFHATVSAAFAQHPGFETLPYPQARRIAETVRAPWASGGPVMHSSAEMRLGALSTHVRIHRPAAPATHGTVVYMHGGGWTLFSLDTHDRLMREYAARAGVVVVGVDYSLSPEAKFPRALEECVAVVQALRRGEAGPAVDGTLLAMAGDSAGANLTVATQLRLRELGEPVAAAMLLNYGAFDRSHTPSYRRYDGPRYMLTAAEMDGFWRNYLGADAAAAYAANPLACPARADLHGLPPAFLAIAQCDILADQNRRMAQRLQLAGVRVESREYRGATHSFLEAMSISELATRAIDDGARWLQQTLAGLKADGQPL